MEFTAAICAKCGSENAFVFLEEPVPCEECHNIITVRYIKCKDCGTLCKIAGNIVIAVLEAEELFFPAGTPVDFMAELLAIDPVPVVEHVIDDGSMESQIRRCIRCDTMAYEIAEGVYKCSATNCGFEWEIVKCG